jgi:hypothetical protein
MLPTIAACVVLACSCGSRPVLWLNPNGQILLSGKEARATFEDRVTRLRTPLGVTYDFWGSRSAIRFADLPAFHLTGSMTIAAWIYPRSYAIDSSGSQILFRGDDRPGLDPYYLRLEQDGRVHFSIQNEQNVPCQVSAPAPLRHWTRITANFDAKTGKMEIWSDGARQDSAITAVRPLNDLDLTAAPGVGVGNLNEGRFNQPYDGLLADLRLYSTALGPRQAGFSLSALRRVEPLVGAGNAAGTLKRDAPAI